MCQAGHMSGSRKSSNKDRKTLVELPPLQSRIYYSQPLGVLGARSSKLIQSGTPLFRVQQDVRLATPLS